MPWVFYALLTAFFAATADALTKRMLTPQNQMLLAWVRLVFAVPVLLALLPFSGIPPLDGTFLWVLAVSLPLEVVAVILYIHALESSPLSLTIPMLAFTPVFLLGTSFLMLGERPSGPGILGVGLIVVGSYLLHLSHIRKGWLEPFRALLRQRGPRLMLGVAAIFSITSNLGKLGLLHSSPLFFGITYFTLLPVLVYPFVRWQSGPPWQALKQGVWRFIPMGLAYACMVVFHFTALSLTQVPYMIAVKRLSLLISVLYGVWLFQETGLRERLAGTLLMLAGFLSITLWG